MVLSGKLREKEGRKRERRGRGGEGEREIERESEWGRGESIILKNMKDTAMYVLHFPAISVCDDSQHGQLPSN